MDYYEELGITRFAQGDEIRKAHRRVSKLVHPDQHLDPSLKRLAETQMRRLNAIAATLLSPEKRRQYDVQQMLPEMTRARGLAIGPKNYANQFRPSARPPIRTNQAEEAIRAGFRTTQEVVLWSILSASVAVLLTLTAVWAWGGQRYAGAEGAYTVSTAMASRSEVGTSTSRCEPTPAERAILNDVTDHKGSGKQGGSATAGQAIPGISKVNFSSESSRHDVAPDTTRSSQTR